MLYGYVRSASGDKTQTQLEWLKNKGVQEVYIDIGSGLDKNRIELNKLLESVKEGDTIFSKGIDRVTRDTKGLEEIIEFAKTKRVKFVLGDNVIDGINGVDPVAEGMSAILSVLRDHEDKIVGIEE